MSDRDDGGQAFPFQPHSGHVRSGMSLRDYFAGQALAGIIAAPGNNGSAEFFAIHAYAMADAMLAARKEQK